MYFIGFVVQLRNAIVVDCDILITKFLRTMYRNILNPKYVK